MFPPNFSEATATSANEDDGAGCVQYIFIPVGVPHAVSLVSAGHRIVAKASVHLVLTELSFEPILLPAVVKDTCLKSESNGMESNRIESCYALLSRVVSHPFFLFCF